MAAIIVNSLKDCVRGSKVTIGPLCAEVTVSKLLPHTRFWKGGTSATQRAEVNRNLFFGELMTVSRNRDVELHFLVTIATFHQGTF